MGEHKFLLKLLCLQFLLKKLDDWDLSKYLSNFVEKGYDNFESIRELTDFVTVGVTKEGHCMKLKAAINKLHEDKHLCFAHKEPFKVFCVNCERLVCVFCIISEVHKQHNIVTLSEAQEKLHSKLNFNKEEPKKWADKVSEHFINPNLRNNVESVSILFSNFSNFFHFLAEKSFSVEGDRQSL